MTRIGHLQKETSRSLGVCYWVVGTMDTSALSTCGVEN